MSIRTIPAEFERAAALALLALAACHDSNAEPTAATSKDPRWRPLIGEVCKPECEWSIIRCLYSSPPVIADAPTPAELSPRLAASQDYYCNQRAFDQWPARTDGDLAELRALRLRVRVHFDPITLHEHFERGEIAPHRALVISGRLGFVNAAGDAEEPITFRVPIRVAIAREPSQAIDWSESTSRNDTCSVIVLSTATGEFHAHVEPWEIAREPGATRSFQVGVGVPDLEPANTLEAGPIPARDTALLSIPGPEPVSETESLIGGVAGPNPDTFEPIALVRAVNHLRSLGKERAIVELDRYLLGATEYRALPWRRPDPTNSDTFDANSVYLIVNRLFVPNEASISDGTVRMDESGATRPLTRIEGIAAARPQLVRFGMLVPGDDDGTRKIADFPLLPVGGIPFFAPHFSHYTGPCDTCTATSHVRWAQQYGVWVSSTPLRPTDDPIGAAEEAAKRGWHSTYSDPRSQSQRSLVELFDPTAPEHAWFDARRTKWTLWGRGEAPAPFDEAEWRAFAERVRAAGVRWDERAQQYVRR